MNILSSTNLDSGKLVAIKKTINGEDKVIQDN